MKKFLYALMMTAFILNLYMAVESYATYFPPYPEKTCLAIDLRSFYLKDVNNKEPIWGWMLIVSNGKDSSNVLLLDPRSTEAPDLFENYELSYREIRALDVKEVSCETGN